MFFSSDLGHLKKKISRSHVHAHILMVVKCTVGLTEVRLLCISTTGSFDSHRQAGGERERVDLA